MKTRCIIAGNYVVCTLKVNINNMEKKLYTEEEVLKLIPFAKNYQNRHCKKPEELLEKFNRLPEPDHVVLLARCERYRGLGKGASLVVRGYLEESGRINPIIDGHIAFALDVNDHKLSFLKEGALYTITIKKS